eukprot:SAG11_NODE_31390_length_292_cov_0.803109_1_plen_65_part_10
MREGAIDSKHGKIDRALCHQAIDACRLKLRERGLVEPMMWLEEWEPPPSPENSQPEENSARRWKA